MLLGKLIKAYRVSTGESLRDIASDIGINFTTVHRIENDYPVDQKSFLLIINWLFGGHLNKVSQNTVNNSDYETALCVWEDYLNTATPEESGRGFSSWCEQRLNSAKSPNVS
jgi:transcriptional regulator with XRE-family HTH domain